MKNLRTLALTICVFTLGCAIAPVGSAPPPPDNDQTGIVQTLIDLLARQDRIRLDPNDYDATSLKQLITLATPAGYRLKLRYTQYGIALIESLRVARDPTLKERLIEEVQWTRNRKVRADAIITLAGQSDPAHKKYFKEAMLDSNVGIRFAAIEALQIWNQPEAVDLLKLARDRGWSPLIRIWGAQALLSMGDEASLDVLWKGLDHNSWVVKAMSARYLGDYARPDDYTKLVAYLSKEMRNDFVVAELSIAALKLISRKGEKISYSPASKGWRDSEEVRYTVGKDGVVEMEPLIIVPPRLRIPASMQIAAQINSQLLRLVRERLGTTLDAEQAQDPILQELNALLTPTGFALQTRYSELSYLIIEGLAGTNDMLMQAELEKLATDSTNPLVRASALISLAYTRDPRFIFLIQKALEDKVALVRFGAMEAIEVGRYQQAVPSLMSIFGRDESLALQVYALQVMARFGDPSARQLMLNRISDRDWPARAMAYWYLGRFGDSSDYTFVLSRLGTEENPFVQTEIVLAALRLQPL